MTTPVHRILRTFVIVTLLAMVAAACGQKDGVHVSAGGGSGQLTDGGSLDGGFGDGLGAGDPLSGDGGTDGTGTGGDGSGGSGGSGGGTAGSGGGSGGTGGTGGAGSGGGTGGGGTGGGGGGGGQTPAGPAWGELVVFGVHAPITGAAPLPNSFEAASQVYPEFINAKGGIHGRQIRVEVVDDEYTPSVAVQKCTELVQRRNAFLLIGGGGTDQIQACARYAATRGVPYLSAGVTEIGLTQLRNYFAVSMSYPAQGPYLARFMNQTFPDLVDVPGMVYSDTPNFYDARDAFVEAMGAKTKVYKLSRNPSQSELANTARSMCADGVKIAYPLMAPSAWLFLMGQAEAVCNIQWSGVGLTMGLNAVAGPGCDARPGGMHGSTFFSPFPGIDKATSMDPEFAQAVQGKNWDDIYVALWSVTKATAKLMEAAGPHLTRAGFVQAAEGTKGLSTGLNPVLTYSPEDHFGADQVHVLQANCDKGTYDTIATFAKY